MAKIVGVHGVTGTNKIFSYAESLSIFTPGLSILVCRPDGLERNYEINWVKPHARVALLSLNGVTNRDQAKALVGSELYFEKARLPKLAEGVYYWFDLIGLQVYTAENKYIGRLDSIIDTGSNDVYVVRCNQKEILIPAIESVILSIDIEQKQMRVELPEGLEET
jgi:16S rRNA processing protein RimM